MKKPKKAKPTKGSSKKAATIDKELPELVAVMMKIAERLEALEKKMDVVVSQTSVRATAIRHDHPGAQAPQSFQQTHLSQHASHSSQQNPGQGGRVLHQAICADCRKGCEVPFKPSGDRPVYCKECFAKRKTASPSHAQVNPNPVPTRSADPVSATKPEKRKKQKPVKKKK